MIVGNGLVANAFRESDREDVVFFASGVSNSLEKNPEQFLREENLLRKTLEENPSKIFVYFSTCSIYDSSKNDSPYVNHKLAMEHIVSTISNRYLIARVSNAVGKGGNPNLLMNYIYRSILNQDEITIHQNAKRNLIDVQDVAKLVLWILNEKELNKIYNIAYLRNFSIQEVVEAFERELGLNAQKIYLNQGESYSIDLQGLNNYFEHETSEKYLKNLILNHYK